jgi:hypothetical protein
MVTLHKVWHRGGPERPSINREALIYPVPLCLYNQSPSPERQAAEDAPTPVLSPVAPIVSTALFNGDASQPPPLEPDIDTCNVIQGEEICVSTPVGDVRPVYEVIDTQEPPGYHDRHRFPPPPLVSRLERVASLADSIDCSPDTAIQIKEGSVVRICRSAWYQGWVGAVVGTVTTGVYEPERVVTMLGTIDPQDGRPDIPRVLPCVRKFSDSQLEVLSERDTEVVRRALEPQASYALGKAVASMLTHTKQRIHGGATGVSRWLMGLIHSINPTMGPEETEWVRQESAPLLASRYNLKRSREADSAVRQPTPGASGALGVLSWVASKAPTIAKGISPRPPHALQHRSVSERRVTGLQTIDLSDEDLLAGPTPSIPVRRNVRRRTRVAPWNQQSKHVYPALPLVSVDADTETQIQQDHASLVTDTSKDVSAVPSEPPSPLQQAPSEYRYSEAVPSFSTTAYSETVSHVWVVSPSVFLTRAQAEGSITALHRCYSIYPSLEEEIEARFHESTAIPGDAGGSGPVSNRLETTDPVTGEACTVWFGVKPDRGVPRVLLYLCMSSGWRCLLRVPVTRQVPIAKPEEIGWPDGVPLPSLCPMTDATTGSQKEAIEPRYWEKTVQVHLPASAPLYITLTDAVRASTRVRANTTILQLLNAHRVERFAQRRKEVEQELRRMGRRTPPAEHFEWLFCAIDQEALTTALRYGVPPVYASTSRYSQFDRYGRGVYLYTSASDALAHRQARLLATDSVIAACRAITGLSQEGRSELEQGDMVSLYSMTDSGLPMSVPGVPSDSTDTPRFHSACDCVQSPSRYVLFDPTGVLMVALLHL